KMAMKQEPEKLKLGKVEGVIAIPKKKKKPAAQQPGPICWQFDQEIPTYDFFDGLSLDNTFGDLQEVVEIFIRKLGNGDFLAWEAVMCHEQGLTLTPPQEEALENLLDPDDDQILYING